MQNILRGNWKLKYFIYGDDEFLVKEKINSIKRKIEPNELLDSNLSDLEGKEISLDFAKEALHDLISLKNKTI